MTLPPSPILGQALRAGGYLYSTWGYVAHPLAADANGLPKVPMTKGWPELRLPWRENGPTCKKNRTGVYVESVVS